VPDTAGPAGCARRQLLNSIEQLPDENLLVSGRHTWALYKLDRKSGNVIWTLGGKQRQFRMGPGAQFAWQHDARQHAWNVLTVFDNGSDGPLTTEHESRGVVLEVDETRRRVTLRKAYTSPIGCWQERWARSRSVPRTAS
jgi:hypothetical protein